MSEIDFSNEALSARVEGGDGGEQEAVQEPAEDSAEQVVDPEAGGESVEEQPEEAPVEDAVVEAVVEDDASVSEPVDDPFEVRYQEAQKVIGRQGQELGELRKQVEALVAAQQQQAEYLDDQPVFQGRVPQSQHELLEMAAGGNEAWEAYDFALNNAPQFLPQVIAEVQAYDPAWAEQMRLDYSQRMMEAQYGPVQQQVQQATMVQQQAQAVQQITSSIDGFDEIREQVAQVVEQMPHLMGDGSLDAIRSGLEFAARLVRAESVQAQAQVQQVQAQQAQQMRQQAAVETGTPAAAPAPSDNNPADQIRDAIFAQDKQRRETITGL